MIALQYPYAVAQADAQLKQRIADWWTHKPKSYLIIAASQPRNRDDFPPIPFVENDVLEMKKFFENTLHYHPLMDAITGPGANFTNVEAALESIHHGHNDKETIVVYFSGHGNYGAGPDAQQDVVLILNDGSEQHLADWVRWARGRRTDGTPSYNGDLIFILDACDSGNGVWRTALTPPELELPTIILASSTVGQRSLQRLDANMSAFSSVVRKAIVEDWDAADQDNDGFIEYRELKDYATIALSKLEQDKKITATMHPEGNTDKHLFIQYDIAKDTSRGTFDHWQLVAEKIIPEALSGSATTLNARADTLVSPTVPGEAKTLAALIPENSDLSDTGRGYKALALGKFNEALTHFRAARAAHLNSPYDVAVAELGVARTKLFAGDYKNASAFYESARAYYGDAKADLLAEAGVNAALSGDTGRADAYLASAYSVESDRLRSGGNRALRASRSLIQANALRALQSQTVVASMSKKLTPTKESSQEIDHMLQASVSLSSTLEKSQSKDAQRTAALAFANAAEIQKESGKSKPALELYKHAETLFDKVDDKSPEYASMLNTYAETLKESNKADLALQKSNKAVQIQSQTK